MDKKKFPKGRAVRVRWLDSASYTGWRFNTLGLHAGKITSIGYVVGSNDEVLVLATSLGQPGGSPSKAALDPVVIPWGAITEVRELGEEWDG